MASFVPTDAEFKAAFRAFGPISTSKAKYLLGMIEKEQHAKKSQGTLAYDWSSKGVTIEHLIPASATKARFASGADYERFEELRDRLWNFVLLERGLNKKAGSLPFPKKTHLYSESAFPMTRDFANRSDFGVRRC